MKEKQGILMITPGLLKEMLGLPKDCVITDSQFSFSRCCVLLKIYHPDLPNVEPGCVIPVVHIERDDDGNFWRWGV